MGNLLLFSKSFVASSFFVLLKVFAKSQTLKVMLVLSTEEEKSGGDHDSFCGLWDTSSSFYVK